jgi:hypothetical protein
LESGVSETIRKPVEDLSCAAILVEPVNYDWSEGYGDRWDLVYPDVSDWVLQQCKQWLDDIGHDYPDPNPWGMDRDGLVAFLADSGIDDWRECVRERMHDEPDRYTPMMSYFYPLHELKYRWPAPEAAQAHLELYGGPVCVALVGDEPVLALTGGGMDLSPEICRAYMLLGYLPPAHFAGDLPRMGGRKSEADVWVALEAVRACEVAAQWAQRRLERARDYLTWVRGEQGRS